MVFKSQKCLECLNEFSLSLPPTHATLKHVKNLFCSFRYEFSHRNVWYRSDLIEIWGKITLNSTSSPQTTHDGDERGIQKRF